jgi:hypothetical protein
MTDISSTASGRQGTGANIQTDDVERIEAVLPDIEKLPELRIYSRSNTFYWWPLWVCGYFIAFLTYVQGVTATVNDGRQILIHPNSGAGITFLTVMLLVLTFTNVTMRGIYSVVFIISVAFFVVLFGWLGWWDDILELIPQLTVHMNFGFYAVFSTLVLIIWMLRFFVFDRLTFWRVRPGQLTMEQVIGGAEESYDTRGMLFEEHGDDFFRHYLLGFGAGDLRLTTAGAKKTEILIPNVLFADRKVKLMQRLIAVKPDDAMAAVKSA